MVNLQGTGAYCGGLPHSLLLLLLLLVVVVVVVVVVVLIQHRNDLRRVSLSERRCQRLETSVGPCHLTFDISAQNWR